MVRHLYVVLPALDEAANLERLFHDLAGARDEVPYNRHERYRFICNAIPRL